MESPSTSLSTSIYVDPRLDGKVAVRRRTTREISHRIFLGGIVVRHPIGQVRGHVVGVATAVTPRAHASSARMFSVFRRNRPLGALPKMVSINL